jgi:hypothetical protein
MSTDLAILVPSRGRPASVARLIEACAKTCRTSYVLHFGFDDDDPQVAGAAKWASPICQVSVGPRKGLAAWTNHLAQYWLGAKPPPSYLASIGDDHLPETPGWDERLITELEHIGGGFAYPNDLRRVDIPEAVLLSTGIVEALGWMCQPDLHHWNVDVVWGELGRAAGRLVFCRDVIVRHLNPGVRRDVPIDDTYRDAANDYDADLVAYQKWRLYQMHKDIETVKRALA